MVGGAAAGRGDLVFVDDLGAAAFAFAFADRGGARDDFFGFLADLTLFIGGDGAAVDEDVGWEGGGGGAGAGYGGVAGDVDGDVDCDVMAFVAEGFDVGDDGVELSCEPGC